MIIFGESFFGRRELVIVLFEGDNRRLLIKRGNFTRTIRCANTATVVLTPCANSLFWHAKLPSKSKKQQQLLRLEGDYQRIGFWGMGENKYSKSV